MLTLVLALAGAITSNAAKEIFVGPIGAQRFEVVLAARSLPAAEEARRFKGTVRFFNAPPEISVDSPMVALPGGRPAVRFYVPYSALTPELLERARLDRIDYRLTGEVFSGSRARRFASNGRIARENVQLKESMRITLRRFVRVQKIRVGQLGVRRATINVDLDVLVPLAFDLRLLEASYELTVAETPLAKGRREKFLLHARRWNRLQLPVVLDYGASLKVAGRTASSRGMANGQLAGLVRLKLPAGTLDFPFQFQAELSLR